MSNSQNTRRVVVDPVTRIEGHLRVQAEIDANGVITDAMSTGTMWRGLEVILKGRDPRDAWAFVERICGVCTGIHALAAVRAVEDAIGIKIPKNANIIRNLMNATLYVQDHLVHFYQLSALDWVDVVSALSADPRETSEIQQKISPHHHLATAGYFRDVQARLKKFVESGQLSIFKNGYWGHPAMKLPPAVNLLAVAHYLEVLDFHKEIIKIHTILGGKNPHPNYLVGGVACPINMHDTGAAGVMVNEVSMNYMRDIAKACVDIVNNVYIPDVKAIASMYPEWFKIGGGISSKNLLCYGDFPEIPNEWSDKSLMMPMGAIIDGKLNEVHPVDLRNPDEIQEFVDHSWYKYPGDKKGLDFPERQVHVGEEPALEGPHDGSRTACPSRHGCRQEHAAVQGSGTGHFEGTQASARIHVLDARTPRRPRARSKLHGRHDGEVRRRSDRQHPCRRRSCRQHGILGTQDLAQAVQGRGRVRSTPRRTGTLLRHRQRQDRQLAGRRPDDVERQPARHGRQPRRL